MRLTHFIHRDGPGGGPKVVRQLLAGLPRDRFQQCVLHGGSGSLAEWCAVNGIATRRVPTETPLLGLASLGRLRREIFRTQPDILVLHGQWAGPLGALALGKSHEIPSVFIAHCPAFYHSTNIYRVVRNYMAETLPCKRSARVVALSKKSHYNYFYRGWVPEGRLVTIRNGLDPNDLPTQTAVDALRTQFEFDPSARHAVFVGRIDDQKRVDWLLDAWEVARTIRAQAPNSPEWTLWIVGEGDERSALQKRVSFSPHNSSVRFVGPASDGMSWIAAADLVVMSSLYEGHALVPLEAMACRRPLASFDTDGVTDSVVHGTTGLLSRLGDASALGADIAKLLGDPALASQMGRAARQHLVDNFDISRTLTRYSDMFEQVLSESREIS